MSSVDPYPGCELVACSQPWASDRVVMVGQAPSSRGSQDPRHALTGAPMRRIFRASGIGLMEYVRTFERHNLVSVWDGYRVTGEASSGSKFDRASAADRARVLADRLAGGRRLVCWGTEVMAAFVGPVRSRMTPCAWYTEEVVGFDNSYDVQCAVLPHPSGLNRWWNDRENQERAGAFVRELVASVAAAKYAIDHLKEPNP